MQLDIYLPSLKLAFEHQGDQHYAHHFRYGSQELIQQRDQEKREGCNRLGITLILIPYPQSIECRDNQQDIGGMDKVRVFELQSTV
jgi:hypothetical protein